MRIARAVAEEFSDIADQDALMIDVSEQLRLIWNARGAVDRVKVEHELSTMMPTTATGPYCKNLVRRYD
jgi:hypothetical protein